MSLRILIVDDSRTARGLIKRCLGMMELGEPEFIEAENGQDALDKLEEKGAVDLILTDLNMPIMDGCVLLRWIKTSPKLKTIPTMVISSEGDSARRTELLELGAFEVMAKPVSPMTMEEALGPMIETKGWHA